MSEISSRGNTMANKSNFLLILAISLVGTSALAFYFLSSARSVADVVDDIQVTVPKSCTMASLETPVDGAVVHSATVQSGSVTPNIGTTTLRVFCNDADGFAVYAIGYSNDEYGNNKMLATVGGVLNPTYDINTGTNTSGNSSWAMKLAKVTGSNSYGSGNLTIENSYDSYHSVPNAWDKVATYHANTGTSTTDTVLGSKLTTTYQAYVSSSQPAGTYVGQVLYTLVHPYNADAPLSPQTTESGKICYYANASSAVGTMGCQTVSTSATSATLLASNFSRDDYGFAGWSDAYDYATNPSANFYGPQEYITFTAGQYTGTNPGLSLYAVWVPSEGSLQDSAKVSSVCNRLTQSGPNVAKTLNSVSALTDERDNQTYAIAKLADGNCWMIENLRLEAENSSNESLSQGFGKSTTYGNFTGLATAESANFNNTNPPISNSKYSVDGSNGTTNIGSGYGAFARMPRYNNINTLARATNPTTNIFNSDNTTGGMYSYGNYYTWSATLANTISYSWSTSTDVDGKTSETVNTSLCPAGWRLPYGDSTGNGATSGGFSYLDIQLGGTGMKSSTNTTPTGANMSKAYRNYPNNFLYSGSFSNSSFQHRGVGANYQTSTSVDNYSAYKLQLSDTGVEPATYYDSKYVGLSIRCVSDF